MYVPAERFMQKFNGKHNAATIGIFPFTCGASLGENHRATIRTFPLPQRGILWVEYKIDPVFTFQRNVLCNNLISYQAQCVPTERCSHINIFLLPMMCSAGTPLFAEISFQNSSGNKKPYSHNRNISFAPAGHLMGRTIKSTRYLRSSGTFYAII